MPDVVKVAAVHAASVFLDRKGSTDKVCYFIKDAAEHGAQLVAFPESFIPGYPFWIWTHTPTEGAPLYFKLVDNSVELDGECVKRIAAAAKESHVHVVVGVTEKKGGTLYNTQLFFDANGALLGRHRKLRPTHVEHGVWGEGDGSDLPVFGTPIGRLGGLICREHSMDLARFALTSQHQQIHVASWPAISTITHNPNAKYFNEFVKVASQYHAWAGQCFVISVSSRIDQAVLDMLGLASRPDMMQVGGGWSGIVAPNMQIVAGPNVNDESVLYGELHFADIVHQNYLCDPLGSYARTDILRLAADFRPQTIVEPLGAAFGNGDSSAPDA